MSTLFNKKGPKKTNLETMFDAAKRNLILFVSTVFVVTVMGIVLWETQMVTEVQTLTGTVLSKETTSGTRTSTTSIIVDVDGERLILHPSDRTIIVGDIVTLNKTVHYIKNNGHIVDSYYTNVKLMN